MSKKVDESSIIFLRYALVYTVYRRNLLVIQDDRNKSNVMIVRSWISLAKALFNTPTPPEYVLCEVPIVPCICITDHDVGSNRNISVNLQEKYKRF